MSPLRRIRQRLWPYVMRHHSRTPQRQSVHSLNTSARTVAAAHSSSEIRLSMSAIFLATSDKH